MGSGSDTPEEIIAHQLIRKQLETAAAIGMAPIVLGTGAGIVNSLQGEEATLGDNALSNTMSNALGYGAIGAGVGALTTPGLQLQAALDHKMRSGAYDNQMGGSVRRGQRAQRMRAGVGGSAKARALTAAGVTAAGAGLANLIGSFRNESPQIVDEEGSGVVGGLSTAAILGAMGLTLMPMDEPATYTDDDDFGYGRGGNDGGGGGGIPPRRPQPGGGPSAQLMLEPGELPAFRGNPQGTNVVDVPAIEVTIADERDRRLGMTDSQNAAYQRVLRRR